MDYSALSTDELVSSCLDGKDPEAWAEFVRRFHNLIAAVVLRTARRWGESSPQAVDDLVQETYLKLCAQDARLLRSFKSRHEDSIFGYIKVVTANLVHDHFKKLSSQKRGRDLESSSSEIVERTQESAVCASAQQIERTVLVDEIRRTLLDAVGGEHAVRDRKIFWLYYRVGMPASAIAALPTIGLSTKGVESTLLRLTRIVRGKLVVLVDQKPRGGLDAKGVAAPDSLS